MITRAMRRAIKRRQEGPLDRAELRAVNAITTARLAGLVLDDRDVEMPAVPGKLAFSVEMAADLGGASLRWNLSDTEIDQLMAEAERALASELGPKRRPLARETVISVLLREDHMHVIQAANAVAAMVTWLIFTGDLGPALRSKMTKGSAGYLITATAPDEWNFRLVAGG